MNAQKLHELRRILHNDVWFGYSGVGTEEGLRTMDRRVHDYVMEAIAGKVKLADLRRSLCRCGQRDRWGYLVREDSCPVHRLGEGS